MVLACIFGTTIWQLSKGNEKDQKEENDEQCGTSDRKHKLKFPDRFTFRKCVVFIAWCHLFGSVIMLNILKDPKKISHIFSTVWIPTFDKRKGSYIFSTVWIPIFDKMKGSYIFSTVWILIFDKSKDWCYLSILFHNARKRNLLFHYYGCSVCHRSS